MATPEKRPEKSKKNSREGYVEVNFSSPPREILHFNQYAIDRVGDFFQISLWFLDNLGASIPVFRGLILIADFSQSKDTLKKYIEKIGGPKIEEKLGNRPPLWTSPPVAINMIDCVDRVQSSELIIRNFSHKYVTEAAKSTTKSSVEGFTYGVYVSNGSIHRQFVMEIINKSSEKP